MITLEKWYSHKTGVRGKKKKKIHLKGRQVVSVESIVAHSIARSSIIIFNDQQFCRQTFSCKVLNIFTPYKQCAVTIRWESNAAIVCHNSEPATVEHDSSWIFFYYYAPTFLANYDVPAPNDR